MWKSRKDETKPYVPPSPPAAPAPVTATAIPAREVRPVETPKMENYRSDVAHIGKSVVVKGELSGSEDLYLDGEVEGSIELRSHSLTIGPNGRVRANVSAKEVVIHGKVEGNIRGTDRVELRKTAVLNGDIATQRIVIEDGAFFKGSIDIQKPEVKAEPAKAAVAAAPSTPAPIHTPVTGSAQAPLLDRN
jgi:cytoskeletal protein CcmA (bactofilin family)